jgi:hypothetical protein
MIHGMMEERVERNRKESNRKGKIKGKVVPVLN